jgi:hypothetical protein
MAARSLNKRPANVSLDGPDVGFMPLSVFEEKKSPHAVDPFPLFLLSFDPMGSAPLSFKNVEPSAAQDNVRKPAKNCQDDFP